METAQKPQARVQRSPAIMKVAVPWLQHSQRFGHWALSQTVWSFKSATSAFVEKNTGLDGSRTLIHGGFLSMCSVGSILANEDMGRREWVLAIASKYGGPLERLQIPVTDAGSRRT